MGRLLACLTLGVRTSKLDEVLSLGLGTSKKSDYAAPLPKEYTGIAAPWSPR